MILSSTRYRTPSTSGNTKFNHRNNRMQQKTVNRFRFKISTGFLSRLQRLNFGRFPKREDPLFDEFNTTEKAQFHWSAAFIKAMKTIGPHQKPEFKDGECNGSRVCFYFSGDRRDRGRGSDDRLQFSQNNAKTMGSQKSFRIKHSALNEFLASKNDKLTKLIFLICMEHCIIYQEAPAS